MLTCISLIALSSIGRAQDIVISNARIIDGNGGVIEQGVIIVSDGRIVSVSAGLTRPAGTEEVDAGGMTVMPGYVDAHRHIMGGSGQDAMQWLEEQGELNMRAWLDAGFTTILSAGDDVDAILELRTRLRDGEIIGPRLITSARANAFGTPEEARAAIQQAAAAGVDSIKTVFQTTPDGNGIETLAAIVDEARRHGLPCIVHVTAVPDMITAVKLGVTRLVHTPHTGTLDGTRGAHMVADAGIPVTSTLGVYVPRFDEENIGRIAPGGRPGVMTPPNLARGGQGLVNARLLWDAGVVYGYGTDTRYSPRDSLAHELRPLQMFFSPRNIVTMLTKNAAIGVGLGDDIGTLEAGKLADIVIVDGDPLTDTAALFNIRVVIKGGEIVVDNR
ncbi:MAG: amidohydrolase family protein [Gammaproteobacteria bacterium]